MMSINKQTFLRSLCKRSLIAILMAVAWGGAKATETPAAQPGLQLRWDQKGLYASPYDFVTGDCIIEGADDALQLSALTVLHHHLPMCLQPATIALSVQRLVPFPLLFISLFF